MLTPLELNVLRCICKKNCTLKEIAQEVNVSDEALNKCTTDLQTKAFICSVAKHTEGDIYAVTIKGVKFLKEIGFTVLV